MSSDLPEVCAPPVLPAVVRAARAQAGCSPGPHRLVPGQVVLASATSTQHLDCWPWKGMAGQLSVPRPRSRGRVRGLEGEGPEPRGPQAPTLLPGTQATGQGTYRAVRGLAGNLRQEAGQEDGARERHVPVHRVCSREGAGLPGGRGAGDLAWPHRRRAAGIQLLAASRSAVRVLSRPSLTARSGGCKSRCRVSPRQSWRSQTGPGPRRLGSDGPPCPRHSLPQGGGLGRKG